MNYMLMCTVIFYPCSDLSNIVIVANIIYILATQIKAIDKAIFMLYYDNTDISRPLTQKGAKTMSISKEDLKQLRYTPDEIAAITGIQAQTIRLYIRTKRLKAVKTPTGYYVTRANLIHWYNNKWNPSNKELKK